MEFHKTGETREIAKRFESCSRLFFAERLKISAIGFVGRYQFRQITWPGASPLRIL